MVLFLYFIGLCACLGMSVAAGRAVGDYFHSWPVGLVVFLIAAYVLIRTLTFLVVSVVTDKESAWETGRRRYGIYATDSGDKEAALEAFAERMRAKNDALSRGVSPKEFDEQQRVEDRAATERRAREISDRLREAAKDKSIKWAD
ncbi:hypothetical protein IPM09_04550 [Candidatus Saccharibacteria bacterium]|nr:MAG: hypothetical protein IPM09_04550 [Candidatus Saccharibacteria bacterium]